jgi:hypothetical protein
MDIAIELRIGIGAERAPIGDRLVPLGALGSIGPAMEIREGGVVGRYHAGAGAGFDRHVADRQPPFDAERLDGRAGIFDDVPRASRGAYPGDSGEAFFGAPSAPSIRSAWERAIISSITRCGVSRASSATALLPIPGMTTR